ncbi:hypothetical protein K6U70_04155, partial [Vibrio vulnificus]|uniref:hypothetical protein n=1 Tax=Vibrio vulnificus TaxID=672 RepID=UPI001EEC7B40
IRTASPSILLPDTAQPAADLTDTRPHQCLMINGPPLRRALQHLRWQTSAHHSSPERPGRTDVAMRLADFGIKSARHTK